MAEGQNCPLVDGAYAARLLGICKQAIYMGWKRGYVPKVNGKVPKLWVLKRIIQKNMHKGDKAKLYRYMVILGFGGFRGKSLPASSGQGRKTAEVQGDVEGRSRDSCINVYQTPQ